MELDIILFITCTKPLILPTILTELSTSFSIFKSVSEFFNSCFIKISTYLNNSSILKVSELFSESATA